MEPSERQLEVLARKIGPEFHERDSEVDQVHRDEAEDHLHKDAQTQGAANSSDPHGSTGKYAQEAGDGAAAGDGNDGSGARGAGVSWHKKAPPLTGVSSVVGGASGAEGT